MDKETVELFLKITDEYPNSSYVFTSKSNLLTHISSKQVNLYLDEVLDILGIKKNITPHCLRRTCATLMVDKIGIYALMKLLGHENIKTTEMYIKGVGTPESNNKIRNMWNEVE